MRSNFSSQLDAVQGRLKFFQNMLQDIQDDAAGHGSVNEQHGVRAKIRALDVHVQHIVGRFGTVKEGLTNTAQELTQALLEKKKILNFSVHHLRAYEVQNHKLRAARAKMHEVRQSLMRLEQSMTQTFANGVVLKVDRSGNIEVVSEPTTTVQGTARTKRYAVSHVSQLHAMVSNLQESAAGLTQELNTEEEHRALLRTLALAVPSSTRDPSAMNTMKEKAHAIATLDTHAASPDSSSGRLGVHGQGAVDRIANQSFGIMSSSHRDGAVSPGSGGGAGGGHGGAGNGAITTEQYNRLREDFAVKLTFLREVYEERIADLEAKVERLTKKLHQVERDAVQQRDNPNMMSPATAGLQPLTNASIASGALSDGEDGSPTSDNALGSPSTKLEDGKAFTNRVKERWISSKAETGDDERLQKHDALSSLNELEANIADTSRQSGAQGRSYISPAYTQALMQGGAPDRSEVSSAKPRPSTTEQPRPPPGARQGSTLSLGGRPSTSDGRSAGSGPRVLVNSGMSGEKAVLKTEYARQQQDKNAEVLRTLRQLANMPQPANTSEQDPNSPCPAGVAPTATKDAAASASGKGASGSH